MFTGRISGFGLWPCVVRVYLTPIPTPKVSAGVTEPPLQSHGRSAFLYAWGHRPHFPTCVPPKTFPKSPVCNSVLASVSKPKITGPSSGPRKRTLKWDSEDGLFAHQLANRTSSLVVGSLRCFRGAVIKTFIDGKPGWVPVGRYVLDGGIHLLLETSGGNGN